MDVNIYNYRHAILKGHEASVMAMVVTKNNQLVSASLDFTIKIWDIDKGECIQTLPGHTACVSTLALTHNSNHLISGSWDHMIKIWNIESGFNCIHTLIGHTGSVYTVCLYKKKYVASGGADNEIRIWRLTNDQCIVLKGHEWTVSVIIIGNEGQIISGSWDKTIKVWNAKERTCKET
jgi:WD40 repeat protein